MADHYKTLRLEDLKQEARYRNTLKTTPKGTGVIRTRIKLTQAKTALINDLVKWDEEYGLQFIEELTAVREGKDPNTVSSSELIPVVTPTPPAAAPPAAAAAASSLPVVAPAPPTPAKDEPRKRRWVSSMPVKTAERFDRSLKQRLYLVDREVISDTSTTFHVLGSTGNVYRVKICDLPSCSCPDAARGNLCKHVMFVMVKVLKVPRDSPLVYQKALVQRELRQIFAFAQNKSVNDVLADKKVLDAYAQVTGRAVAAPAAPAVVEEKAVVDDDPDLCADTGVRRRPMDEDCPICFEEMAVEATVWCKAQCGQSIHSECLQQLLTHNRKKGQKTPCPMCRADWYEGPKPKPAAAVAASSSSLSLSAPPVTYREGNYMNLSAVSGQSTSRNYNPHAWRNNGWKKRRYNDYYY